MHAHAVVVVLGDLGRSPRMQYHAHSLCKLDSIDRVTLIGYEGEQLIEYDTDTKSKQKLHEIRIHVEVFLSSYIIYIRNKVPFIHTMMKGCMLLLQILYILLFIPKYDIIIIQNPPCIPVAMIAIFLSFLSNGSSVIIDWHNLGFAMFEEKLGKRHPIVMLSKAVESVIARWCCNICVSEAMKAWISENFSTNNVRVLYDRPPSIFKQSNSSNTQERHELLVNLRLTNHRLFPKLYSNVVVDDIATASTIQTHYDGIKYSMKSDEGNDRVSILISSTSWTEDEDFNILLDALIGLEKHLAVANSDDSTSSSKRRILVVITGKGPMKSAFDSSVKSLCDNGTFTYVSIQTLWLESKDYPKLISYADLGVCLHTSTSGLDLPMKVLDMFGSGIPVLGTYFPTLPELIKHKHNGLIFHTRQELLEYMIRLLSPIGPCSDGDDVEGVTLLSLKREACKLVSWDENWSVHMSPYVTYCLKQVEVRRWRMLVAYTSLLLTLILYIYI